MFAKRVEKLEKVKEKIETLNVKCISVKRDVVDSKSVKMLLQLF